VPVPARSFSFPTLGAVLSALLLTACGGLESEPSPRLATASGFRGIWYANQRSRDEYGWKYAGGFATYPQQHVPIAYFSAAANKTFFTWGGVSGTGSLLHMVSYFDHATGHVAAPRILLDKETKDAHDNPTLMLDDDGYVWIFSNAHGKARPAFIHRSRRPLSIDAFEHVLTTNFSYSQPWYVTGIGWCFLHTRYEGGRLLYCWRSRDGRHWEEPRLLAKVERGHYQVSWRHGRRVGTAFNFHPKETGLNGRTNLYYMETDDGGRTWRNASGEVLALPLTTRGNGALVRDYLRDGLLVYLKDLQFDRDGRPVILFLTSRGWRAGPGSDPRIWHTARWDGRTWDIRPAVTSDHNYDYGPLYIDANGGWHLIAPTDPGPQPYGTGGEIVRWESRDRGATWRRTGTLTKDSVHNHTYVRRPVDAHPDFHALWADGHGRRPSKSWLYFATKGGQVVRLPTGE
jgi:hypothetical protein